MTSRRNGIAQRNLGPIRPSATKLRIWPDHGPEIPSSKLEKIRGIVAMMESVDKWMKDVRRRAVTPRVYKAFAANLFEIEQIKLRLQLRKNISLYPGERHVISNIIQKLYSISFRKWTFPYFVLSRLIPSHNARFPSFSWCGDQNWRAPTTARKVGVSISYCLLINQLVTEKPATGKFSTQFSPYLESGPLSWNVSPFILSLHLER